MTGSASNQNDPERFSRFTPRDWSVLELVSAGHTNVQIGAKLHISRYTVSQHIGKMLRRTGATNRTDLVNRAYQIGVLPRQVPPPDLSAT